MKVLQPLDISVNPSSAPLITNSSTKVGNLNVDLLDGLDSTDFVKKVDAAVTANTGTAYTVNLANGTLFNLTLTGNCTFTFPTATLGTRFKLLLKQDITGSRTITWPHSVRWSAADTPIPTSSPHRTDIISFIAAEGVWLGIVHGQSYGLPPPTNWVFTVSSVYSWSGGFTNPPTQAGLSNGVNTVTGTDAWASDSAGTPQYIMADFVNVVFVTNAYVMCANTGPWREAFTNGRLLQISSNGTDWTTVATISGVTSTNTVTIPINTNCRYVRVYVASGYVAVGDFHFD